MKIHHIRNATMLVTLGEHRVLVDPMLSEPATLPGFKLFGGGRRKNPLVPLPADAMSTMEQATEVLVTHEHPDHLDVLAIEWIRDRGLAVWAAGIDASNLTRKGLDARTLPDAVPGLDIEVIPGRHGRGVMGWLMGPVSGFYLSHPDEPSLYLTGDTVLTDDVQEAMDRLRPELIIAPAGAANFGIGSDIIFSAAEQLELVKRATGDVLFNHLEALDHCPTTRAGLRETMDAANVGQRVFIPADGERLEFSRRGSEPHVVPKASNQRRPGFQKWLTAKFAGT